MIKIEKDVRKRARRKNIQDAILATIFYTGALSVAMVAPKMTKILEKFEPEFLHARFNKSSFNRSLFRLKERGFIVFEKTKRGNFARITLKGVEILRRFRIKNYKLKKPYRWDRKWRILIFDIKEKRRGIRDQLRRILFKMGFIKLQNSVWVYPYDCEDLVNLLKIEFKIGKDLLYIVADRIENDKSLVQYYKL